MISLAAMTLCGTQINPHLTIYPLVPPEAQQGWKLELFEVSQPIAPHYHKIQRQIILVAEGELQAFYGMTGSLGLKSGDLAQVDPGIVHSLVPLGSVRFFSLDLPGFVYPEDVFHDRPERVVGWARPERPTSSVDPKYFGEKIDLGIYSVYEIISGNTTQGKWSVALLDIDDSPRHFHKIEKEVFIVVNGELDIEIEGMRRVIRSGESVMIEPNQIHHLKKEGSESVRVLCFSFPAFDPSDMYCVEGS